MSFIDLVKAYQDSHDPLPREMKITQLFVGREPNCLASLQLELTRVDDIIQVTAW